MLEPKQLNVFGIKPRKGRVLKVAIKLKNKNDRSKIRRLIIYARRQVRELNASLLGENMVSISICDKKRR